MTVAIQESATTTTEFEEAAGIDRCEENALLRGVIRLAITRLDGLIGEPGQDVEAIIATVRDELEAALA